MSAFAAGFPNFYAPLSTSSGGGGGGGVTGSGIAGRNAYWTGTSTISADPSISTPGNGTMTVDGFQAGGGVYSTSATMTISGTMMFSTEAPDTCVSTRFGLMRVKSATGSSSDFQICRGNASLTAWYTMYGGANPDNTNGQAAGTIYGVLPVNNNISFAGQNITNRGWVAYTAMGSQIIANANGNTGIGWNLANSVNPTTATLLASLHVSGTAITTSWTTLNSNSTPIGPLSVPGLANNAGTHSVCYNNVSGLFTYSGACTVSDESLKTNVVSRTGGLARIMALRPVDYEWLDPEAYGYGVKAGFIAQQVAPVIPQAVSQQDDGKLSLVATNMIPDLVLAVQELKAEVELLKEKQTLIQ